MTRQQQLKPPKKSLGLQLENVFIIEYLKKYKSTENILRDLNVIYLSDCHGKGKFCNDEFHIQFR